jgi:hypothetical protein
MPQVPGAQRPTEYRLGAVPQRAFRVDADTHRTAIRCTRLEEGERGGGAALVHVECADGTQSPFPQTWRLHSDGFEFGYRDAGPADLALNILALLLPIEEAMRLHLEFKAAMVATIPTEEGGTIQLANVRAWVDAHWAAEDQDLERMDYESAYHQEPLEPERHDGASDVGSGPAEDEARRIVSRAPPQVHPRTDPSAH